MERGLREQIERLLADAGDGPDGVDAVRARLAATLGEGLEGTAKHHERGEDDPALLAAHLDDALSEAERAAVLASIADDPARRANLASAAALLDAIEPDPPRVPAGLMALAQSNFAAPVGTRAARPRWIFRPRAAAIGWAGAALLALVLVPGIVLVRNDRIGSPSRVESISQPQSERAIPPPAAAPAGLPKRLNSRTRDEGIAREPTADQALVAPEPSSCDPPPAAVATTAEPKAGSESRTAKSAATAPPCPPKGAADAAKTAPSRPPREDGTSAAQRRIPAAPSAVAPAPAR